MARWLAIIRTISSGKSVIGHLFALDVVFRDHLLRSASKRFMAKGMLSYWGGEREINCVENLVPR
jgi:hypothetical protein